MKQTDILKVKELAKALVYLPIEINKNYPLFVSHPYTDSTILFDQSNGSVEAIDVTTPDGEARFHQMMINIIDAEADVLHILWHISKSYRFSFVKYVDVYLSSEDLGRCVRDMWINAENTNNNRVFSKRSLVGLFHRCSQDTLMNLSELNVLKNLPDSITIYRGVGNYNNKDLNVFSWTLSYGVALWFAKRFGNAPEVYQADIQKTDVLAYFDIEKEIVVNPFKLKNIQKIY